MDTPRSANTMSDAIALSSPSGHMSKRSRKAAEQRLCMALFGKPEITLADVKGPKPPPMAPIEKAAHLRRMAALAGPRQARALLKEAAEIGLRMAGDSSQ